MSKLTKFFSAVAVVASTTMPAFAADTVLKISSWVPPTHGINTKIFAGMIEMIEKASGGQVSGELVFGLAPPPAQMDLIQDGVADIAIIFHGYQPGRFVGTKLIELPGYEGNAEAASVAYWRVHEAHLAQLNEHRGVKLISLNTHGPGQMHTSKAVSTLADLDGTKTRIGGGVAGDVGAALGLIGVNVPAPKVYETLESGAADAVAMPLEGRVGFKLNEVAKTLYEMPGGFYRGSFAIIMSQERFDSLPADVQAALDADVFGEPLSRHAGASWDAVDTIAYEASKTAAGVTMTVANEADQAAFSKIAADVRTKVLAELSAAGVDAAAAYAMVQAEMSAN